MIRTNLDRIPVFAVQGAIAHPRSTATGFLTPEGQTLLIGVGIGGIAYNVRLGGRPPRTRCVDSPPRGAGNLGACRGWGFGNIRRRF